MVEDAKGSDIGKVSGIRIEDLEWQPVLVDDYLHFDDSQQLLQSAGFERHPFIAEVFELICQYLDDVKNNTGMVAPEQAELVQDILQGKGEWCCQAIETLQEGTQRTVRFYELLTSFPAREIQKGRKMLDLYDVSGMEYSGDVVEFDITDLGSGGPHHYKKIHAEHDDVVRYLTSRSFSQLPKEIQKDGFIYIPKVGTVLPLARFRLEADVSGPTGRCRFASRGVRVIGESHNNDYSDI